MPWLVVNGCMKYFRDDDPKYEAMKEQQDNKPKKRKRTKKQSVNALKKLVLVVDVELPIKIH